jgi:DNA-binding NarL/FixJ family response regulator
VKQHVSAIFKKLDVNNRSQAILAAAPILSSDVAWKRSA